VVVDAVVVPVVENDIALGGVARHERAGTDAVVRRHLCHSR
jgi:hypothetical protein